MIPGNSGCGFIFDKNAGLAIKYSNNFPSSRLESQILKQQYFKSPSPSFIKTPRIYTTFRKNTNFYAIMEFINGKDFIEYIDNSYDIKRSMDYIFSLLSTMIDDYFLRSYKLDIQTFLFYRKINEIKQKISSEIANQLDIQIPEFSAWQGPCHGDLTLSNLLINDYQRIFLFDFLNTYCDSPIQDIVKLRQDTHHKWIKLKASSYNEKTEKALNILDKLIVEKYSNKIDPETYYIFQYMNLIRILPYSTSLEMTNFILQELQNISWEL
jgi:hypothetical protein